MAKHTNKNSGKRGSNTGYDSLHDLLILKLNSLLYIERALLHTLPTMANAAHDPDLGWTLSDHVDETENQVHRLEVALSRLGEEPKKSEVAAIDGLIKDAQWCMTHVKNPDALDALLIAAAKYIERYETAGYEAACQWAEIMGQTEIADLLEQSLMEERNANIKLTELADMGINQKANTHKNEPARELEDIAM